MKKLTTKQLRVLEAIEWFYSEHNYSPSIRELADMLNSCPSNVFKKMIILEDLGYIKTDYGKARSIRIIRGVNDAYKN